MSKITKEQIISLGEKARIAVTTADAEQFLPYFTATLTKASELVDVNTAELAPTTHGIVLKNVLREDLPHEGLTEELVFKNAPEASVNGQFRVPAILD